MFAIGHFALGYLIGKGSSKLLKTNLNLPLLLVASVLPDLDLILQIFSPAGFMHRGVTHSIVTITVLMIPFFIIYRKQAIPYYAVILSHSLLGDFFTGGIEMLWPLSQEWFGTMALDVGSFADAVAEFILFVGATAVMFKAKDLQRLLKPKNSNLLLLIAFGAVLGPVLAIRYESGAALPTLLVIPSFFWLVVFAYSMLIRLWTKLEKSPPSRTVTMHVG
jgi:membrane-bound metal-dependent hydrolase YbcI (DUF457 family)